MDASALVGLLEDMGFPAPVAQAAIAAGCTTADAAIAWMSGSEASQAVPASASAAPTLKLGGDRLPPPPPATAPTPATGGAAAPTASSAATGGAAPAAPEPANTRLVPAALPVKSRYDAAETQRASKRAFEAKVMERERLAVLESKARRQRDKARVLQQLEEDKAMRALRATGGAPPESAATPTSGSGTTPTSGSGAAGAPGEAAVTSQLSDPNQSAQLQVRLPGGKTLRREYASGTPLRAVLDDVCRELQTSSADVTLMSAFPRRVFQEADFDSPLAALGLAGRSQLVANRSDAPSSQPQGVPSAARPGQGAPGRRPGRPAAAPPLQRPMEMDADGSDSEGDGSDAGGMHAGQRAGHPRERGHRLGGDAETEDSSADEGEGDEHIGFAGANADFPGFDAAGGFAWGGRGVAAGGFGGRAVGRGGRGGGGRRHFGHDNADSDEDDQHEDDDAEGRAMLWRAVGGGRGGVPGGHRLGGGVPAAHGPGAVGGAGAVGAAADAGAAGAAVGSGGVPSRPSPSELRLLRAARLVQPGAATGETSPKRVCPTSPPPQKNVPSLLSLCIREVARRLYATDHPILSLSGLSEDVAQPVLDSAVSRKLLNAKTIRAFAPCGLQSLRLRSYDHASDQLCHALKALPTLTAIDFDQCETLTADGVAALASLPRLQHLSLSSCRLHDRVLPELMAFRRLTHLKLANMDFSDACMAMLLAGDFGRQLVQLNLSGCSNLGNTTMQQIAGLTQLQVLNVARTQMAAIGQFRALTVLKSLDIAYTGADGIEVAQLSTLTALQRLGLEGLMIDSRCLAALAALRLRELTLPDRRCFNEGHLRVIAGYPLTHLSLASYRNLGASAFLHIATLGPTLERLDLTNTHVDDATLAVLAPALGSLHELSVARTAVGDEGVKALARIATLTTLDLSRSAVTNAGVAALSHCGRLHSLNLMYTRVSTRGVLSLVHCHMLTRLNLRGTWAVGARVAEGMPQLRDLQMGRQRPRPQLWDTFGTDDEELAQLDPEEAPAEPRAHAEFNDDNEED